MNSKKEERESQDYPSLHYSWLNGRKHAFKSVCQTLSSFPKDRVGLTSRSPHKH